jgi:hypothetical protein
MERSEAKVSNPVTNIGQPRAFDFFVSWGLTAILLFGLFEILNDHPDRVDGYFVTTARGIKNTYLLAFFICLVLSFVVTVPTCVLYCLALSHGKRCAIPLGSLIFSVVGLEVSYFFQSELWLLLFKQIFILSAVWVVYHTFLLFERHVCVSWNSSKNR